MGIDFHLYLISDRTLFPEGDLVDRLCEAAHAGVRAIQLREKDLPRADVELLLSRLLTRLRATGTSVLVNSDIDLAAAHGCGVHLPSPDAGRIAEARHRLGPTALIGVSTHSLDEAKRAQQGGASFVTYGPVFATPSKKRYGAPQGLANLHAVCAGLSIPVIALGGIDEARARACMEAGASGVACIRAILAAPRIDDAVRGFGKAIGGY